MKDNFMFAFIYKTINEETLWYCQIIKFDESRVLSDKRIYDNNYKTIIKLDGTIEWSKALCYIRIDESDCHVDLLSCQHKMITTLFNIFTNEIKLFSKR